MGNKPDAEGAVSATQVARCLTTFDWLTSSGNTLHWVESLPEEDRAVVVSWDGANTTVGSDAVGNALHAYGGGPYVANELGTWVVCEDDGQIWHLESGRRCTDSPFQHGDLTFGDGLILCVRETATGDELIVLDPATCECYVAHRASFIASPKLTSGRLAWTQWSSDVMPWDSSELWVANYQSGGQLNASVRIAGGADESAVQPQWGPDNCLYFMSDRNGWWNLYRWCNGEVTAVAPIEAECAPAPWELGYRSYTFLPNGKIAMIAQTGSQHRLLVAGLDAAIQEVDTPYTSMKPYLATVGDRVALIGSSPLRQQEIALVAVDESDPVEVVRAEPSALTSRTNISVPETITFESGGVQVTALWYPATDQQNGDPAPLVVRPHPGPTHHAELRLDWEVQFFTSRGYSVADVNYRGSTGYGRSFRKALDGHWGVLDVEDCRNAAKYLIQSGRARTGAVFISGASAGGYTALKAVCDKHSPFRLAVARSAIVNPKRWETTAPRFQRPHATQLSHNTANVEAEAVCRPVLLIHGQADAIAPIQDVVELAERLEKRRMLIELMTLPKVGHYLSAPHALIAALEAELGAYQSFLSEAGQNYQDLEPKAR